jgi:membrane protein implicated in regulation of membrane protease activity
MPQRDYFFRMTGAFILGIIALIMSGILFFIFLPYILAVFIGTVAIVFIFVFLWLLVYIALYIGVAIYYLFKPMEINKKRVKYTIKRAKESGRRQKRNK